MAEDGCICLACGSYYRTDSSPSHDCDEKNCPKCGSGNIVKLNTSKLFGFSGGGG